MAPNRGRGILDLLILVQAYGAEVVTYPGGFVGLQGSGLRALPDDVWQLLDEYELTLGRMVRPSPTPYRRGPASRKGR
jgi:hypothetical protein